MDKQTEALKNELDKGWKQLTTIRDQIRVKLHLAGMDAKDAFVQLEKDAKKAVEDLNHRLEKLSHQIDGK